MKLLTLIRRAFVFKTLEDLLCSRSCDFVFQKGLRRSVRWVPGSQATSGTEVMFVALGGVGSVS